MLRALKSVDLYKKANDDIRIPTTLGGSLSLLSGLVIAILLLTQTYSFIFPSPSTKLIVEEHSDEDFMVVSVNISFATIPCNYIVSYYSDSLSVYYDFFLLNRSVIDRDGTVLSTEIASPAFEEVANQCGSCYGAETRKDQCCNSCAEVMETYGRKKWKPPEFGKIEQCQSFLLPVAQNGPGCLLTGDMKIKKIPGTIQFRNAMDVTRFINFPYNGAHKIHSFEVRDPKNHKKAENILENRGINYGRSINYYLKLMPVVDEQDRYYKASSNSLVVDRPVPASVTFTFDIEPITSIISRDSSFTSYVVSLCAIIGGWHAVTLLIAKLVIN